MWERRAVARASVLEEAGDAMRAAGRPIEAARQYALALERAPETLRPSLALKAWSCLRALPSEQRPPEFALRVIEARRGLEVPPELHQDHAKLLLERGDLLGARLEQDAAAKKSGGESLVQLGRASGRN
jgi:hypothetical protein